MGKAKNYTHRIFHNPKKVSRIFRDLYKCLILRKSYSLILKKKRSSFSKKKTPNLLREKGSKEF